MTLPNSNAASIADKVLEAIERLKDAQDESFALFVETFDKYKKYSGFIESGPNGLAYIIMSFFMGYPADMYFKQKSVCIKKIPNIKSEEDSFKKALDFAIREDPRLFERFESMLLKHKISIDEFLQAAFRSYIEMADRERASW